jgi:hypothetical protein
MKTFIAIIIKVAHGVVPMRIVLLFILIFPLHVFAADNMMINTDIQEITLQINPTIGMTFTPGIEPGVVISLPEGQSAVIPGYRVRFKGVAFIVGISCDANLLNDCSTYQYSEDYRDRLVYMRYLQISDRQFKTPEGSTIGDRWDKTIQKVGDDKIIYSGNDSCVLLKSGWHACIDLMSAHREFDLKARRLLPKKTATIDFFYKSK